MASTIKVDNVQNQPGTNIINKCGTTITLGASSDTVALAAGASQTGFGRTGTVDWVTTPKTATFTAATGSGYFCDTTAGVLTVNLPAGAAGSIVSMADYAATWQTYAVTVTPNGAEKIGGTAGGVSLNTEGQSVTLVYVDSTQGWVNTMDSTSNVRASEFMVATGGTPCTGAICGDYKIHTFTGPGTFCVSAAGASAPVNIVDYVVVAGGGGGSANTGGGGGGGFRFYANTPVNPQTGPAVPINNYGASPNTEITVTATGYPITVGAGGVASCLPYPGPGAGARGVSSVFSTVTSTGGGGASNGPTVEAASPGGSGGGGGNQPTSTGGLGNTPPVSPSQGMNGGSGLSVPGVCNIGGGGGGAIVAGTAGTSPYNGGIGGAGGGLTGFGTTGQLCGGQYYFSGGGGANTQPGRPAYGGGGLGGGGASTGNNTGTAGTVNTGGGGGGGGTCGTGGSGIVVIRYKFQ